MCNNQVLSLPSRLHEVLMDLQQQQLQQLSDWLSQTEERIMKIETEPPTKDMEAYKERIEQHKVSPPFLAALSTLHSRLAAAAMWKKCSSVVTISVHVCHCMNPRLSLFSLSRSFRVIWRRSR